MNVVQSYLTTIIRGEFSLYEIRIFLKIVELANQLLGGKKVSQLVGKAVCVDGLNCNLSIPIKSIMTDGSMAYNRVREALNRMMHKTVELYDQSKDEYRAATLLNNIRIAQGDGLVKFVVPKWLLEYILNFVNGNFSMYDLQAALSLPSAYAVRMYWLTCSMRDPVDYPVMMLKQMLGAEDKYKETKDFIKRCIDPAQKILSERNLNGFSYQKKFTGNKCTHLQIIPVKRQKKEPKQLVAMAGLSAWCPLPLRQYLQNQCGFSMRELSSHKDELFKFSHIKGYEDKIIKIVERQRRKRASKGYIIASIKAEVKAAIDRGDFGDIKN